MTSIGDELPTSFFPAVRTIWQRTRKRVDHPFNTYVARPVAAALVLLLRNTPITPNQVTFISVFLAIGSMAIWIFVPGPLGSALGGIGMLVSFITDCADGQLARVRNTQSAVGHHLDFLMDEIKAFFVFGALTVRMWRDTDETRFLLIGLGGLVCVASGISLTTFMRRPEYTGETQKAADGVVIAPRAVRKSLIGRIIGAIEWAGRQVVHYPQYIVVVALINRLDLFFYAYAAVNLLYLGRSALAILWKLGRFSPRKVTQ